MLARVGMSYDSYLLAYMVAMPEFDLVVGLRAGGRALRTSQEVLDLEKPIEMEEIQRALHQLAHNKAPGSDGLPAEYYRAFSVQMLKPYLEMLKEAFGEGRLPESQRKAVIVVLPKPGRDPLDVRSLITVILLTTNCINLCRYYDTSSDVVPGRISGLLCEINQ
ncbi:hypothetical protein NDU88_004982 [Pleurodeles waltl]|uniref:Uncharacterized protein n=1 Tax=Pleurodeles waltl TaxID=8319 RepID=A0AAV7MD83_PLEWA|nr:hypothetical protein NDU88_004982 [Pleurodeles waltl]